MDQLVNPPQTADDPRRAKKIKRAGQSCITLFVVLAVVVATLSFGKAAWVKVGDAQGYRLSFNFISSLGLLVGIYAVIFLASSLRTVLGLSSAKKVLGLIGSIGLICHSLVSLLMPLNYGGGAQPPAGAGGNPMFGQNGSEQWIIDGKTYQIASTYHLVLPEGPQYTQYTIEFPYQFTAADSRMDDQRAIEIAFPLMRYAVESGNYKRMSVYKLGEGNLEPTRIGVVLVERTGGQARGYRVALPVAEVQRRIAEATTSRPSSMPR
jgi:hypothetical protein